MRISAVRIGKLVSGPGYNNSSAAVEVALDEGDDIDEAVTLARRRIETELRQENECGQLRERLEHMRLDVRAEELTLERLKRQVADFREVVRQHDKLRDFAKSAGILWAEADDGLPF